MTRARYYPKADSVTQDFSTAYPGAAIVPDACLWHSTEGARWEPYGGGSQAPHFTVRIDPTRPRTCAWRQHFPLDRSARALANAAGGVETNKEHVVQVEIVATSGWASDENPTAPYKVAPKVADLPDWFLRDLGEFAAFLNVEWGIPLESVEFAAWNAKRPTMTEAQWLAMAGHVGHQHAPENDHTDPGELDILRILWHAQTFLIEWTANGYPYGAPAPTPEPPPVVEPVPEPEPTPDPEPPPVVVEPPTPEPVNEPKVNVGVDVLKLAEPKMRGPAVTAAQQRLTAHGKPAATDGIFGAGTDAAVRGFQAAKMLTVDGVVGAGTWAALLAKTRAEMTSEVSAILVKYGWRSTVQAVKDFQRGYNLGPWLSIDGVVGAATYAAAVAMDKAGGKLSANFTAAEFACRCGGRFADCRRIWVHRGLLAALEKLRPLYGSLRVVSGSRCVGRNKEVGGYSGSQHLDGGACDVEMRFSASRIASLGVFSGIGYDSGNRLVRHVDVRHLGRNDPYGTTSAPRIFAE